MLTYTSFRWSVKELDRVMLAILHRDVDLVRLAREIAIDHYDIEDLLDRYKLSYDAWRELWDYPRFTDLLANEEESWASAKNTRERVKLKSASVIEMYLEDAAKSLLDAKETLVAKTGLAKLIAGFAGIGTEGDKAHGGGSGFSITINLGDKTLQVGAQRVSNGAVEDDENDVFEPENDVFGVEKLGFNPEITALDAFETNADLG
jgi:hypothetical protein